MNRNVLGAVFRRNLYSYFVNPTGYLFICLFVLLSTFTAFCTNEFFNSNLANLGQLNVYFPWIMLLFVPAITMAVWADERRQGTDELLLTIPGGDFDIVLGKYLAVVAIYTVALVFAAACHLTMLRWLGNPDLGLFAGTYAGYWLVGAAMLAVGMAASFLTGNLTIGYILGLLFNVPLVLTAMADNVFSADTATLVKQWSISEQFADFGRGLISLSGSVFFLGIVVVMLYLAMVLIGRRHWQAGVSGMPGWLSYLLVHVPWLLSFVGLGMLLRQFFTGPVAGVTIWAALAVGYMALHTVLLTAWSSRPVAQQVSMLQIVVPVMQVAAAVLLLVCLSMFQARFAAGGKAIYLLVGLYAVIHVILFLLWLATPPATSLVPGHYVLRTLILVGLAATVYLFFQAHDLRWDVTAEKLSSLSPDTTKLLRALNLKRPVQIEAFISPEVPEGYVPQRLNLLSMLHELQAFDREKIRLRINDTTLNSEESARAEARYGITPRPVVVRKNGVQTEERLFMGVAFSSGMQKVIIPFIDRGIPVEYELVRSICTVCQQEKKKIGVLNTDAQLYGGFNMQTMSNPGNWPIVDELEKQYELVQVDPNQPITDKYAVLLAVQPSTLGPPQMDNFVAAVRAGQPTAIFEDPFPFFAGNVTPTSQPKQPPQQMGMMGNPEGAPPKGDIGALWKLLGIDFSADKIVGQQYNPYHKRKFPDEFVFVDDACGAQMPFNEGSAITSKLQHLLFPFPGSISALRASNLKFIPLVRTGDATGYVRYEDLLEGMPFMRPELRENPPRVPTRESYVLAAEIEGKIPAPQPPADDKTAKDPKKAPPNPKDVDLHAVVVADIDMLSRPFFLVREIGVAPDRDIEFEFDNVTFVLNAMDVLAGDNRFLEIRKRRPLHRTLTTIDRLTEKYKQDAADRREVYEREFDASIAKEQKAFDDKIKALQDRTDLNDRQKIIEVAMAQRVGQARLAGIKDQLTQKKNREVGRIDTELNLKTLDVQNDFKRMAAIFPPILPLALAVVVLIIRRNREREGVSRRRLR